MTTTYGYNSKDLVEWETLSVDGQAFTLNYGYNSTGNLTTTIYPGGASIGYAPNALNQPTQAGSYATGATYHPSGMVKSHNYANGFGHTSTLNNSGLPATFHDLRASTYALNHAFSYDANHNLTFWDDKVNNAYDVQATYDGLDRLNTITDSYLGAGDVNYDAMGNITYYKLGSQAITYVYDSAKRLVQTTGSQSYAFTYDDRGNVTGNGQHAFTYNAANQMVAADSYVYLYDGNNKRVKQDDSHGVSYSFYGSNGKLMYRNEGGVHVDYYYLGGKLVAKKKGSTVTYLHADYLGSSAAESNTAGAVTRRMHYQPFGEPIETPTDDIGYTAHKFDTDLDLNYMQARYYDPVLGRFMANDPVGFTPASTMTFNRYSYANNNSYKFTDPDGRSVWTKLFKLAVNGGDIAQTLAGVVSDYNTLTDSNASLGDRVLAGVSLASEASPVSIGDIKDAYRVAKKVSGTRSGPSPNNGAAAPHGGVAHNSAIDSRVEQLRADPTVTNIRKNQVQVDVDGNRVGDNRPDLQYDQCGTHNCVEFDTNPSRSKQHGETIRQNDPNARVELNEL